MNCTILHESDTRLRVHMRQYRMTMEQADQLQAYLEGLEGVRKAVVYDRTADAVITFRPGRKRALICALSEFGYERTKAAVPENTGRALQHEYEDRMANLVLGRAINLLFFPAVLRTVWTVVRSVPFIVKGIRSLMKGKLEVSVLDAASISVSMLRGDFGTAGSIMFLLSFGDLIEDWKRKKSVDDLARTMSLNVDKVWVRTDTGEEVLVGIRSVKEGDTVIVRTGNMIPLDGIVLEGDASVNQSSITGEPLAVHKEAGGFLYAGTVVEEGELAYTVKQAAGSGRYDRIVRMIEDSEKLKSATEAKASRMADRLVPWTFGATFLTWLFTRNLTKAASILNVDFCCALKISIPIAVMSAMREAGDHHISVRGGKFLEAVSEAQTIVFDKTGTLTEAQPKVHDVIAFDGQDPEEMLRLAACLEEHFPHSIANAVVARAMELGLSHEEKHSRVEYVVAHGIASSVDGVRVRIGSEHFIFEDEKSALPSGTGRTLSALQTGKQAAEIAFDALPAEYSHLYLAIGGKLAAVILIEDPLKQDAASTVEKLHEEGFLRVVMLTGDSGRTAKAAAQKVGVDDYRAEVLPEDKAEFIRAEHRAGRRVIMIGDGINDSPALSEADAGIAINSGAAIAREVADIVISASDLESLILLRRLSRKLMSRINGNYRTIVGFNSFLILMGMLGVFQPTTTALLHNTSTVLLSLYSMSNLLPEETDA